MQTFKLNTLTHQYNAKPDVQSIIDDTRDMINECASSYDEKIDIEKIEYVTTLCFRYDDQSNEPKPVDFDASIDMYFSIVTHVTCDVDLREYDFDDNETFVECVVN